MVNGQMAASNWAPRDPLYAPTVAVSTPATTMKSGVASFANASPN
jgi:hypothetical protein